MQLAFLHRGCDRRLAGIAFTAGALALPGVCLADALYVATGGADTNPGTRAAPFRTIQRAANAALPGATIYVEPGTYRENVRTKTHGTVSARIRYVSADKWGARIIGSGTEAAWTNSGDFADIVGFDITGSGRLGVLNRASHTLVSGNHVHDLAVSGGCTGNGGAGIMNANYRGADNVIIGNVVHDIGVPGQCNGIHGIYHTNLRGRISDNIVYRASSFGIHLWHAANSVVISNNTVFANGGPKMGGGILLGTGDLPGGVVLNHTQVFNNIVYDNPAASIEEFCYPGQQCIGANNTVSDNLVYRNGRAVSLLVGSAEGTIVADPQFIDYRSDGSGDYRLKQNSPALRQGMLDPATDIGARDNY